MSNPKGYGVEHEPKEAEDEEAGEEVEEETPEEQKVGRTLIEIATGKEIPVEKAVTSKGEGDNVKKEFWICPSCAWMNPMNEAQVRCQNCGAVRIDPRTGKIAKIQKYW